MRLSTVLNRVAVVLSRVSADSRNIFGLASSLHNITSRDGRAATDTIQIYTYLLFEWINEIFAIK